MLAVSEPVGALPSEMGYSLDPPLRELQSFHLILNHFPFLRIRDALTAANYGSAGLARRARMVLRFLPRLVRRPGRGEYR